MLNSISSPAQAKNELLSYSSPIMRRVLSGERFTVTTDRIPRDYRIYIDEFDNRFIYCGNYELNACKVSYIFPNGFVVCTNILGDIHNISIEDRNIRMVADMKGGARC